MDTDGEDSSKASCAQKETEYEALNLEFYCSKLAGDQSGATGTPGIGSLSVLSYLGGNILFWLGSGSLFSKPRQNLCSVIGQKLLVGGVCTEK